MFAYSRIAIPYAGQSYGPGLFEVDEATFQALGQRGPVLPATQDQIEASSCAAPASEAESAAAAPVTERAVERNYAAAVKTRAPRPKPAPAS